MTTTPLLQLCKQQGILHEQDVPLKNHCTFKIGGSAELVTWPENADQLKMLLAAANGGGIPVLILGKGSNVLFSDNGYAGLVICLGQRFGRMERRGEAGIFCESGASLSQLCLFALENGLSGLEFAYGIPGTVGGAVYMNAGAYGGEMKDVLEEAYHLHPDGTPGKFAGEAMALGYRRSAYSGGEMVITGALLRLQKGDPAEIRAKMDDYLNRRREKQPLEYPSAGSTFKRPEGAYASALIDRCGLKGCRAGGAMVSEKHAGFVINCGGATCADVLALMDKVAAVVKEKTGFQLEPEVKYIGK